MKLTDLVGETYKKLLKSGSVLAIAVPGVFGQECGDCNSDMRIDIVDALAASQHYAGISVLSDERFKKCNVEGVRGGVLTPLTRVDVLDALKIAKFTIGIDDISCFDDRLLFVSGDDRSSNVYISNLDGSWLRRLTNDTGLVRSAVWFPRDGSMIAYSTNDGGRHNFDYKLWLMDNSGCNKQRLTFDDGASINPSWLDETTIVFQNNVEGNWNLYKINIVTGTITQLTSNSSFDTNPSCFDGRVAFSSGRDGNSDTYVMDGNGSNLSRLTFGLDCSDIFFGNDGKIYFARQRNETEQHIWSVDASTGTLNQITQGVVYDRFPCVSEGQLYFSRGTSFASIYDLFKRNLSTGQETLLHTLPTSSKDVDYGRVFR